MEMLGRGEVRVGWKYDAMGCGCLFSRMNARGARLEIFGFF